VTSIRSFLQRDMPDVGFRVPAESLRRFWQMLAHLHEQLFKVAQLGLSLGCASQSERLAQRLDSTRLDSTRR